MDWVVRNISFLASFLMIAAVAGIALRLLLVLGRASAFGITGLIGELAGTAIGLIAITVGYGLLVRLLSLCDGMAAIRGT